MDKKEYTLKEPIIETIEEYTRVFGSKCGKLLITIINKNTKSPYQLGKLLITQSPFGNCQIYTIGYMCTLLHSCYYISEDEQRQILKVIQLYCLKKQLVVDIHQGDEYRKLIKLVGKEAILKTSRYKSTNGSNMVIVHISTENFLK